MKRQWDAERALIWAVRDQRVEWSEERAGLHRIELEIMGKAPPAISADGCAGVERLQELGTRVDGGGGGHDAHPDAIALYRAALTLGKEASRLLFGWADMGLRPPIGAYGVRAWPQRDARGDVLVLLTEGMRWRYCALVYIGGEAETEARRGLYAAWHDALVALDARLHGVALATIDLVPLEAEAEPWRVDAGGRPATLLPAGTRAALLEQARAGIKPTRLAASFGLTLRQVYKQLEVARRARSSRLTSVP